MCVIIHKPAGKNVEEDIFQRCWENNPHGSGFMYAENGEIKIIKGMMSLDDFLNEYYKHDAVNKNTIIHFRFATSGQINQEQTHPFWVFKDKLAFVHNGHINNLINRDSDTLQGLKPRRF